MSIRKHIPWHCRVYCVAVCLAMIVCVWPADAQDGSDSSRVAVIVSKRIRPYAEALKGVQEVALPDGGISVRDFWLDDYPQDSASVLETDLSGYAPDILLTIGPEALHISQTMAITAAVPVVYTVVLNPERILGAPGVACGISLKIPVSYQVSAISRSLPDTGRIGLLFDPAHNRMFFEQAMKFASAYSLVIVPLEVRAKSELSGVLEEHWSRVDALWMIPDPTVISERIVQYIIRQAISEGKPVIGFNRFFYESGAVVSFEFDYQQLGVQAGELVRRKLIMGSCTDETPVYSLNINATVAGKIRVRVSDAAVQEETR